MGMWAKSMLAGAGSAALSIITYDVISVLASPQVGTAMAIIAGAATVSAVAAVWAEELQHKKKIWLLKHDKMVRQAYMTEIKARYKLIDKYAERYPSLRKRESAVVEPEAKAQPESKPIRKICGVMDFSKAPEELRREFFSEVCG